MILEEETFATYGYSPSNLKPRSGKSVLAACDGCGNVRITSKNFYRALCGSCSQKGRIFTEEHKKNLRVALKGNINSSGHIVTKENRAKLRTANIGAKSPHWKGGEKLAWARRNANRRKLGYTLLMPLKKGEQGHHITNDDVIGIPAKVHQSMASNSRKKHRTLVLQWLKVNDKKKYIKVLCILANTSNPSGL